MKIKVVHTHLFFILLIFFFANKSYAKHIVGGEASYKLISSDKKIGGKATYQIKFVIYRDAKSGGGNFDNPAFFGIFKKEETEWIFFNRENISIRKRANIRNVIDKCLVAPKEIQYERGEYQFQITLPIINSTYKITYQRCCRTNFIVNIHSPEATGATYYVDITPEAQLMGNSSPKLTEFPPTVLCADTYFEFDHSATDDDGDSLVYEFFTPLNGGGLAGSIPGTENQTNDCDGIIPLPDNCPPPFPTVKFKAPYTFSVPIKGTPDISINRKSGILTGRPIGLGSYVVGVRVKEYRNGKFIGSVQRDFQFLVTACTPAVNAVIANAQQVDVGTFEAFACGEGSFTFNNISYIRDKIETVYWEFDINGEKAIDTEWDGTIVFPDTGLYYGKLILNKDIDCEDSAFIKLKVFPGIDAEYNFKYDSCIIDSVSFFDKSISGAGPIQKWDWIFGDGNKSDIENPVNFYENPGVFNSRLIVEDINKCRDTAYHIVNYFPLSEKLDFVPSGQYGCTPLTVFFDNKTGVFDDRYRIIWDFGDGTIDSTFSPTHTYSSPGKFNVNVRITSPIGCSIESINSNLIEVKKSPVADFDFSPKEPNIVDPKVVFENKSIRGNSYLWDFGTGYTSTDFEPVYTYLDTGLYRIMLVATSTNNCEDTIFKSIFINADITIFFPNAFTPNGDGKNDEFFGKFLFPNFIQNFTIRIWDRWGGMVFESEDPLEKWYGSKFNSGEILPQGVYVYKYSYNTPSGKVFKGKGFITLIK